MNAVASTRRLARYTLVGHLSRSLGQEKAEDVVDEAAHQVGIGTDDWERDEALLLLEALANMPGLVGVVARFAKARIILTLGK